MKLGDMASVSCGLVLARKQAKKTSEYRYKLLNLRCIREDGEIDLNGADNYEAIEQLKDEHLTKVGDIVVRLTAPYTAVLIDETTAGMVISSNFVVIRIRDNQLLPEYLYWLLNTSQIKRDIYKNSTGNMLSAVNAKYFMGLDIAAVSREKQQNIADLFLLGKKEVKLLKDLVEQKEKFYTFILNNEYTKFVNGDK
ncbi:Uncharacterised protein [Anaerobiospirillum thomasii]|uniref:Uncharacterized protein n=1 Tax=Anaerobiospirillum thomasii TaxID=179995 RepID=A0A2X0VND1_9GAMM|nr:restriction endonuclease subunit S [Anaerobiospirillum thomasii]SPT68502.1 Uncharacterised protein [Anaerobiospirillum thomasii]SPT71028.1 Uncharacterised protein [Anaerobiospirillum thomasii]